MPHRFKNLLFAASFIAIPLKEKSDWKLLRFRDIPKNEVSFEPKGMRIGIDKSSSPMVYPLENPTPVNGVEVKGFRTKGLQFGETATQGGEGADDFALKVGLVVEGEKTLNFFQRTIAADWIQKLYSLAPEGLGIDRIQFFAGVDQKQLVGKSRVHPLSDLIHEQNVWFFEKKSGDFSFRHMLKTPLKTLAIWLSVDGDDTNSRYEVRLKSLKLIK